MGADASDGRDAAALDAAAAELLILPPAEFTRARNDRAAAETGALARGIRGLRKPTVAAWAVNLLSHDAAFREALELSGALREAQDDLDAAELARLGRQRRALVAALARRAGDLARDADVTLAAGARDEIERTVNAAIVDPVAGAVVAAGRLLRPLDPGAVSPDDLAERVAGSIPGVIEPPAAQRDDLAGRRARREAEKQRREAERAASDARRELTRLEGKTATAREKADRLHERVDDLRRDLARVLDEAETADAAVDGLERQEREARAALSAAERKVRDTESGAQ